MTYDFDGVYIADTCNFIPTEDFYLLGLLNSKLIYYFYKWNSSVLGDPNKGGRLRWKMAYVIHIPIRTINPTDPADKARHDRMVALVNEMLELHKHLSNAKTDQEKRIITQEIESTDRQIDSLVYGLYGLTADEIVIVEETVGR
jgi:hypothetical protein